MVEKIKELESERDNLLSTTEYIRLTKNSTAYSRIKDLYNRRIAMLKKYGLNMVYSQKNTR